MRDGLFRLSAVFLGIFCLGLMGCAGNESKLERARYLLGSGKPSDAIKAANEVKGLIDSATGEFKVEVMEVYSGALLSSAGFNGIKMLVNILHREDDASVATVLRSIFEDQENALQNVNTAVLTATEVVGTVTSGDLPEPLLDLSEEDQADYGFASISPMEDFSGLSEEYQKRAFYAAGIGNLYRALFILLKVSGFWEDNFTSEDCEALLKDETQTGQEGIDSISLSLYRSESYLVRAGFDESNKLIEIVRDLQGGANSAFAIDVDRDGFVGEGPGLDMDAKTALVCDYLNESFVD